MLLERWYGILNRLLRFSGEARNKGCANVSYLRIDEIRGRGPGGFISEMRRHDPIFE